MTDRVSREARPDGPQVDVGLCSVFYAFDVGFAIDLDRVEALLELSEARERLQPRRRAPAHFQFRPAPLRMSRPAPPVEILGSRTADDVSLMLLDFGAVSVTFHLPIRGPFTDLLALSETLYEHQALEAAAWREVTAVIESIAPAVSRPRLSDAVEEYVVYNIRAFSHDCPPAEFIRSHRLEIAQLLRSERAALSRQEVNDALSVRLSFAESDAAIIDWNAALVLDPDPGDVLTVLEYANVQLVEMRHLDNELDDALEKAYEVLSKPIRRFTAFGKGTGELRRIAMLQADGAIMFEAARHSLKLLGDQYMARLYRAASGRFHLKDWDESIRQKLSALESIYTKRSNHRQNVRLEILEWIIILLIALSIVLSILPGMPAH